MQEYLAEVIEKKYLTPNVIELLVKLIKPRAIKFRAGQFVFFNIGGAFKAYSITSLPVNRRVLRFLIKLEKDGAGSNFVKNLKIAQGFEFTGPEGNFIFKSRQKNICCVAAGIGIAPFVSMIPHWLSKAPPGKLVLVYAAKIKKDILYFREFTELSRLHKNFRFVPLPAARLEDYLEKNYQNFSAGVFYVCGKPAAVNSLKNMLDAKALKLERVYTESFLA